MHWRIAAARPANPLRRISALPAAALLTGCALFPPQRLAPAPFAPLTPASLGRSVQAEQILRIAYGEQSLALQCAVSVTAVETAVTCFTALGQRAFQLRHDGHSLHADAADAQSMAPDRILTDLQLAYWPLAALSAALPDGWQLSEPAPGVRRLRRDGVLHTEVHYGAATPWNGRLWLVNFAQGYSLDIGSRSSGKN